MVIVNKDGRIQLINAQTEKLFGYTPAGTGRPVGGAPRAGTIPPRTSRDTAPGTSPRPRPRAMGSGLELFGLRKDGTEFPIEISLSPLQTEEGTLVSSAIRDITERKRLEQRMQEASRLKSEFLANMSHELRTPLNAIIGFAELMHRGKVGPVSAEHQEYLGDILTSSKHLLHLINDVLDLAKIESGKMEFRPESVDLAKLAREVCDILRGLAASQRLQRGDPRRSGSRHGGRRPGPREADSVQLPVERHQVHAAGRADHDPDRARGSGLVPDRCRGHRRRHRGRRSGQAFRRVPAARCERRETVPGHGARAWR